jgi:hypothetical protein
VAKGGVKAKDESKSIAWTVGALALAVALFGWGFMAGFYAADLEGFRPGFAHGDRAIPPRRGRGIGGFVANGVRQIPNAPAVLSHNLRNHAWVPGLIVMLEAAAIGGGLLLKGVEARLDARTRRIPKAPRRRFTPPPNVEV